MRNHSIKHDVLIGHELCILMYHSIKLQLPVTYSIRNIQVNLMEHMKMSTSRDFRINVNTVQAVMENNSDSEGSEEEGEEENNISTPEEEVDEVFLSLSVSHND